MKAVTGIIGVAAAVVGLWRSGGGPEPTYHGEVSRIIQNNCQTCHRRGGIGPFPFERYEDVVRRRALIEYVIENRIMPPWHADEDVGTWSNSRALPDHERDVMLEWIAAGTPEGDPADAPPPAEWVEGWSIGEPDAVVRIPEPVAVPARGVMEYRYAYVKTDFPEDRWVQAMELRPTAVPVTHHILAFIESPDAVSPRHAREGDEVFQGGIDGFFASWVPGSVGNVFRPGTAKLLPKGAWLKFQLHYTPRGEPVLDQSMLGFVFADRAPERPVRTESAWTADFVIPAGADRHEVRAAYRFREAGSIIAFLPHMHYRGASFQYDLEYPDGRTETVMRVPRYNFHWQITYEAAEPIPVPAGAVLRATGWFDNSANNPLNPDPTADVSFGEQSWHEMMIGYFDWVPGGRSH